MAPALTEASDPQTFHVAAHHHHHHHHSSSGRPGQSPSGRSSSPPATHLPLQYGGLKEPHDCTDAHLAAALANCSRRASRPPGAGGLACGREGCDPPPRPHATHTTMDPPSGPPSQCEADSSTTTTNTQQESSEAATMGQDTTPDAMAPHKSPRPPSHDGDLLALIGRDFPNMNEIIDTLTRLADNPEVLAAVDNAADQQQQQQQQEQQQQQQQQLQQQQQQQPQPQQQQDEVPKEERARLLVEELGRRQWLLERRQARLQRRLRRVTSRGLSATVSGQLRDLLDHGHAVLAQQREQQAPQDEGTAPPTPPEVNLETLRADAMRSMSTTALVNLVRRVEASQGLARLASASHRGPARTQQTPAPSPALPEHTRVEVGAVVGEMQAAAHAHTHHDSDATETSSGGESCDELEGFPDTNTNYTPVQERAFARYCRARAWVASRWTWLQAQIADLEYRILQQHKIYSHIRNTKGAVQVEEAGRWKSVALRDPAHLDMHDPALTCLAAPTNRTAVNGYHSRMEEAVGVGGGAGGCEAGSASARTQGIRAVKRRRLVRAGAGLCAGLRRGGGSGRIPAVQCKCVPPLTCVLCTRLQGVTPPAAPPDPYTQPASERHARVDPTYHPVLSQPADVSLSEKFDVMLKTMDWQRQALTTKTPQLKSVRENLYVEKKKKKSKDKEVKKDHKKHKKDGKGRITLKLKRSLFTGELTKDGDSKRKKSSSQEPILPAKKVRVEEDDDSSSVYGSSLHSSPTASPAPIDRSSHKRQSTSNQKNKQTISSNSYDIDNIVIPHSMAASTRVEKLEYKEIPTPKWRIVPYVPNNVYSSKSASHEEEDEDVSEEAVAARHSRSEELERKKFLQYLHMQVTSRSSRSRRTDSSGTNTPDHPLSPRPPDPASDTISPLATPPTTPLAPSEDSNQSSSLPTVASIQSSSCSTSGATSSSFTTLVAQAGLSTISPQPSQQQHQQQQQHQPSQLLIHNSQISSNSILTHLPSTSISTASSITTTVSSSLSSSTPSSIATFSSLLSGARRNRTFSSSSATKSKVSAGVEEGAPERLEGMTPYEQRVFPLNDAELMLITRETEDCDIGPPSPPFDTSANDANNCEESGRSTPMSEVTDSAPEEDGEFDDTAAPKWTISGLKDATGQCVLQIHRN
ncbi:KAT8 regulatory NSL complex subunit 1-like isoform X2 [Portunus trituberculatus]|uniref:KAT8 regulatory NSL complex subunit 1-like isoform X2 n=1 Tax=Portunus trituberculatus TaxID=210409 RepID=UPI001E1D0610|nr:KAT8 regulatory NSL complex subunit 1-like isoform X2 [Portunus trituberculatus]